MRIARVAAIGWVLSGCTLLLDGAEDGAERDAGLDAPLVPPRIEVLASAPFEKLDGRVEFDVNVPSPDKIDTLLVFAAAGLSNVSVAATFAGDSIKPPITHRGGQLESSNFIFFVESPPEGFARLILNFTNNNAPTTVNCVVSAVAVRGQIGDPLLDELDTGDHIPASGLALDPGDSGIVHLSIADSAIAAPTSALEELWSVNTSTGVNSIRAAAYSIIPGSDQPITIDETWLFQRFAIRPQAGR